MSTNNSDHLLGPDWSHIPTVEDEVNNVDGMFNDPNADWLAFSRMHVPSPPRNTPVEALWEPAPMNSGTASLECVSENLHGQIAQGQLHQDQVRRGRGQEMIVQESTAQAAPLEAAPLQATPMQDGPVQDAPAETAFDHVDAIEHDVLQMRSNLFYSGANSMAYEYRPPATLRMRDSQGLIQFTQIEWDPFLQSYVLESAVVQAAGQAVPALPAQDQQGPVQTAPAQTAQFQQAQDQPAPVLPAQVQQTPARPGRVQQSHVVPPPVLPQTLSPIQELSESPEQADTLAAQPHYASTASQQDGEDHASPFMAEEMTFFGIPAHQRGGKDHGNSLHPVWVPSEYAEEMDSSEDDDQEDTPGSPANENAWAGPEQAASRGGTTAETAIQPEQDSELDNRVEVTDDDDDDDEDFVPASPKPKRGRRNAGTRKDRPLEPNEPPPRNLSRRQVGRSAAANKSRESKPARRARQQRRNAARADSTDGSEAGPPPSPRGLGGKTLPGYTTSGLNTGPPPSARGLGGKALPGYTTGGLNTGPLSPRLSGKSVAGYLGGKTVPGYITGLQTFSSYSAGGNYTGPTDRRSRSSEPRRRTARSVSGQPSSLEDGGSDVGIDSENEASSPEVSSDSESESDGDDDGPATATVAAATTTTTTPATTAAAAPVAPRSAWSAEEEDACIECMGHVLAYHPEADTVQRWEHVARRLNTVWQIGRSVAAVKNAWNRRLREKSGIDERKTKGGPMKTSQLKKESSKKRDTKRKAPADNDNDSDNKDDDGEAAPESKKSKRDGKRKAKDDEEAAPEPKKSKRDGKRKADDDEEEDKRPKQRQKTGEAAPESKKEAQSSKRDGKRKAEDTDDEDQPPVQRRRTTQGLSRDNDEVMFDRRRSPSPIPGSAAPTVGPSNTRPLGPSNTRLLGSRTPTPGPAFGPNGPQPASRTHEPSMAALDSALIGVDPATAELIRDIARNEMDFLVVNGPDSELAKNTTDIPPANGHNLRSTRSKPSGS